VGGVEIKLPALIHCYRLLWPDYPHLFAVRRLKIRGATRMSAEAKPTRNPCVELTLLCSWVFRGISVCIDAIRSRSRRAEDVVCLSCLPAVTCLVEPVLRAFRNVRLAGAMTSLAVVCCR
jgi:hypothetical protein